MKFARCLVMSAVVLLCSAKPLFPQEASASSSSATPNAATSAITQADFEALKQQLAVQQQQLARQQQEIEQLMEALRQRAPQSLAAASPMGSTDEAESSSSNAAASTAVAPQTAQVATAPGLIPKVAPTKKPESGISVANGRLRIGGLFYGDYAMYYNTGFGPQFNEATNFPGPANDRFNSFDLTRAYLNFIYAPNDSFTLRIMPDIYRQIGAASADKVGAASAFPSSVDGNLSLRLKYAYIDLNKLFDATAAFNGNVLTFGQQANPFVGWEEDLYGYRFANLVPWNYLGFSSSQVGLQLHGPVTVAGRKLLDYGVGVFDQANFHQFEQAESKQAMARLSVYPFRDSDEKGIQGLGFTGFVDYGYKNVAPDSPNAPLYRMAALVHYVSRHNGYALAGEYDSGRNAFGTSNLFSGSAPADEFGLAVTPFANFDALAKALLGQNGAFLQDVAFFGHAAIPHSPLAIFGNYNYTRPNTNVIHNPLDFARSVVGLSYAVNPHLTLALDGQNVIYVHRQFTFPAAELARFSPSLATKNPNGINNAVPNNIGAIFLNSEFSF